MRRSLRQRVERLPRSIRFLFAGGFAAAVNWLVRFPLSVVMPFFPAVVLAAAIGMAVGFVTYRGLVFASSDRPILVQIRDFVMVNLSTTAVVVLVALALEMAFQRFLDRGVAQAAAHALGIGVGAVLNYAGHSRITFRPRSEEV